MFKFIFGFLFIYIFKKIHSFTIYFNWITSFYLLCFKPGCHFVQEKVA